MGMVADMFFSSSFCCVCLCASRCFEVPFFLSKEKGKVKTTKKGFKVSSISHPKHGRGHKYNKKRRLVLSRLLHKATPSKDPEWPREREEEEEEEEESANGNGPARRVSFASNKTIVDRENISSLLLFCVLFSSCRARARRTKTRSSSASLA